MDIKIQLAALSVVSVILFSYLRNRRLPLMSTKLFTGFLFLSVVNLVSETAGVYAIYMAGRVPDGVFRFCRQVSMGSLDLLVFLFFLYVGTKANIQKRYNWKQVAVSLTPAALSMAAVLFGELRFSADRADIYSYSPISFVVYLAVAVYAALIVRLLSRETGTFSREARTSILLGLCIWLLIAVYQLLHPFVRISAMANALMVLFMYLSFEDPREYIDAETGTLNARAFHLMLAEMMERRKRFFLLHFVLEDMEMLKSSLGHAQVPKIIGSAAGIFGRLTRERIYHSRENMISIMVRSMDQCEGLMRYLEENGFEYRSEQGFTLTPKYHISVQECPKYAGNCEEVFYLMDYLESDPEIINSGRRLIVVDEEAVRKKNYRAAVEKLVMKALEEDGFEVYYQPIYSVSEGRFITAEALVRLKDHDTLGFVSPEIFVPILEKRGFVRELGAMVFEKVCDFAQSTGIRKFGVRYIEVNISGMQAMDAGLSGILKECMERHRISPDFINLEITETFSADAGDMLRQNMDKLRKMGCGFSMDDFGTGYSNLSKMARLHFELIKLDKSLIWPCFEEDGAEALIILNNCIRMLRELGVGIVAEGVETQEQARFLAGKGVEYLQGYYFSKPLQEKEYLAFLRKKTETEVESGRI